MRAHAIFYRILFFLRLSTTKQIDKQAYSKSSEKVSYQMKHRFLIHSLSHTILVVDITQFGLQIEINARTRNMKMIPALRFPVWKEAEQYFRAKGR
jgi:hypothetical protein